MTTETAASPDHRRPRDELAALRAEVRALHAILPGLGRTPPPPGPEARHGG